jgi:KUP system potassium uptake protein
MLDGEPLTKRMIKSLGLVFGDIGTSPIYTFTVVILLTKPTEANIEGVLSLIIWTLMLLVTVAYVWLAMSLGKKGEGGTIVLKEILVPLLKSGRKAAFVACLSYIGVSLLIGDGVITPAISILSAVEGALLIPGLEGTRQEVIVFIAAFIAVVLFSFQRRGTEKVSVAFGPLMVVWFAALAVSGLLSLSHAPWVVKAINPYYAIKFLAENGIAGFFVLSEVILCATGGEALYADMGHLGRRPIVAAWYIVFTALVLNYLGQGAFLLQHPGAKNVLFEMVFDHAPALYIPFLLLTISATVIASQAMISGIFSIFYQGIRTHMLPLFKVDYTSRELKSQVYVSFANWFLLASVLVILFFFRESRHLAAAYGLAVTGTMTLTGIMMTWIFYLKGRRMMSLVSLLVSVIDGVFLLSCVYKIPHGGYWSIIIALIPFCIILLYTTGQKHLHRTLKHTSLEAFVERYTHACRNSNRIKGTALFFTSDLKRIAPYIIRTMFTHGIIYEDSILVSMVRRDNPFGASGFFKEQIAPGLRTFEIQFGYMEVFDVEEILRGAGIDERAIFYGIEDIATDNVFWKVFAAMRRQTPTFVQFHKLPPHKLHGIITRVDM